MVMSVSRRSYGHARGGRDGGEAGRAVGRLVDGIAQALALLGDDDADIDLVLDDEDPFAAARNRSGPTPGHSGRGTPSLRGKYMLTTVPTPGSLEMPM